MHFKKLLTRFSVKSISLLILIISFVFQSCGQHGLKTTQAFFQQTFQGTVAVDDNGNLLTRGTDTLRFLYITSREIPFIDTVIFFGKSYQAIIEDHSDVVQELGIKKASTERVSLRSAGRYKLWRIDLEPLPHPGNVTTNKVWILGLHDGKAFRQEVKKVTELEPELRQ